MRQSESQEEDGPSVHDRLHSAPKGLLRYYILHKIAQKPIHGYEIIQDIDSKTEGAWRPGAGSLYPILKKLVSEGLIKADPEPSNEATRRVYQITPKGVESLAHAKEMLESKQNKLSPADLDYILKEYALNLERQMNWANRLLNRSKSKAGPTLRQKVAKAR